MEREWIYGLIALVIIIIVWWVFIRKPKIVIPVTSSSSGPPDTDKKLEFIPTGFMIAPGAVPTTINMYTANPNNKNLGKVSERIAKMYDMSVKNPAPVPNDTTGVPNYKPSLSQEYLQYMFYPYPVPYKYVSALNEFIIKSGGVDQLPFTAEMYSFATSQLASIGLDIEQISWLKSSEAADKIKKNFAGSKFIIGNNLLIQAFIQGTPPPSAS